MGFSDELLTVRHRFSLVAIQFGCELILPPRIRLR
jgi:hypothetical protein